MLPAFSAFVIFAFVWFLTLLCVLPWGKTQAEAGDVVLGTPRSAPHNLNFKRKLLITTIIATVIWAAICAVILSGRISIHDIDVFHRWMTGQP